MTKAILYHAGCSVCINAKQDILNFIPKNQVEVIHLGENKTKVTDVEKVGVQSVPVLVLPNKNVLHINFGASIKDLK